MAKRLTVEEKEARAKARTEAREKAKKARKQAKRAAEIESMKNQRPVKSLTITVEWKRSRMYGHNPHATASVEFWDGTTTHQDGFTCSGCGYDKSSTVLAEVFNAFLAYKLWRMVPGGEELHPYGMTVKDDYRFYNHGVGESCYYHIAEHIGGKLIRVASTTTLDVYRYEDDPSFLERLGLSGNESTQEGRP